MKTPEEMAGITKLAKEWANKHTNNEFESALAFHSFMQGHDIGYKAGSEVTEQEIADIIVDIRQREAEERKRPQRERQDRIWEKIKIKIIGVF